MHILVLCPSDDSLDFFPLKERINFDQGLTEQLYFCVMFHRD